MSLAERADLTARLSLDDKFSRPLSGIQKQLGGFGKSLKTVGKGVAVGVAAAVGVGAAVIGGQVKAGIANLATLEDATTSLDGAIKQVGKGWTITGSQVAAMAQEIEYGVQSAFDDKDIAQATTTLIRYGSVTQQNLPKAMQVMTDLAAKTGDVSSASTLLGKALADPAKAAGKLARVGVVLTKAEQAQIKTLVKSGQMGKAQALILTLLAQKTRGAAQAMHGPFVDAQLELADAVEEAQKALAIGFLPVLTEVRKELTDFLSKKENLQKIKDFGQGLADGFREVVKFVKQIPWDQVAGAVGGLVDFGKGVASAFMGLPPDVKAILIGLTALNKLSGGAVIKVGVDVLGAGVGGLFQQFLGRGSIANPMVVIPVGGGGLGGGVGGVGAAGAAGGLGLVGALGVAGLVLAAAEIVGPEVRKWAMENGLSSGKSQVQEIKERIGQSTVHQNDPTKPQRVALSERQEAILAQQARSMDSLEKNRLELVTKMQATTDAAKTAGINAVAVARTGDAAVVAAIKAIQRPVVNVGLSVTTGITVYSSGKTLTRVTTGRYAGKIIPVG